MRYLYSFIFYLFLPFILLRLLWRARKNPAYLKRWSERFGYVRPPKTSGIWFHAVSVGEAIAAIPLIKALQQQYPKELMIVTTTTPTGSERITQTLGNSVWHVYAPYDLPDAVTRFLKRVKPRVLVIMETELWPNLLYFSHKQGVPIFIANARLSDRSARGYRRLGIFAKHMLQNISFVAAQTTADAERFIALGMNAEQVCVAGNLKFALEIPANLRKTAQQLRNAFGAISRPVWIAASTHEGEDQQILQAHARIKKYLPECLLLLVPRHPERFNQVAELCRLQGYKIVRRSSSQIPDIHTSIYLGDTMGELLLLYALSDVAFVGGSLVPTGGHNLLEPLALEVPAISGPHTFNFSAIAYDTQTMGAVCKVNNADELADAVLNWLQNPTTRQHAGFKGREYVEKKHEVIGKYVVLLQSFISANKKEQFPSS